MDSEPFHDYNPYELLQELARQNKELYHQWVMITDLQKTIGEAVNSHHERLRTHAMMIQHLNNKINILIGELNEKETNSRPTR